MTNSHAGSATSIDLAALEAEVRTYELGGYVRARLKIADAYSLIALARATPRHPEAPADGERAPARALPDGWIALSIQYNGREDETEEVAYGPKHMMDRLGKWLDKYFARVIADRDAATPQHSVTAGRFEGRRRHENGPWLPWAPIHADNEDEAREWAGHTGEWRAVAQHSVTEQALNVAIDRLIRAWAPCNANDFDVTQERIAARAELVALAQPLASTAAALPEQASVRSWEERVPADFLAYWTRRGYNPAEAAMLDEIADLRAALAIPASTAASEQQAGADERVLFEAWYGENYTTHMPRMMEGEQFAGEYVNMDTQAIWCAWQARAALTHRATTAADQQGDTATSNGSK